MLNTYESAIDYLDNLYEEKVSKEKAGAIAAATAGALVVTGLTALTLKEMKKKRERINKVEHYYMTKDKDFVPFSQLTRTISSSSNSSSIVSAYDSSNGKIGHADNDMKIRTYEYVDDSSKPVLMVVYTTKRIKGSTSSSITGGATSLSVKINPKYRKYSSYYLAKVESVFSVESGDSKSWLKEEYDKLPKEFK